MTYALNYVTASDRGLVRQNNEDSAYAGPSLLAVADGMGGHAAGEVASQLMIAALSKLDNDAQGADLLEDLRNAMYEGNASIAEEVEANPVTEGMGTTLTALLFDDSRVGLCHVGDSRGYLLRDGTLTQITRDDTYVQSLVDEGRITADEASVHPQRSLILKALTGRPVEPTLKYRDVRQGDRYLICSDGLSDPVSRDTIEEVLAEGTPREAADKLVSLALRSGGPDNVTIVVADVVDASAPTPSRPSLAGALGDPTAEGPRPDTSAGRAAAMRPPAEQSRAVTATPEKKSQGKSRWIVIAASLLALALVSALGVFAYQQISSSYYVTYEAAASSDEDTNGQSDDEVELLEVRSGVPGSILGLSVNSHDRYICLDDGGGAQLADADLNPDQATCHLMRMTDLNQVGRSMVQSGLPTGSLDEITDQITRLDDQTLPVCLTVEHSTPSAEEPEGEEGGAENGDDAGSAVTNSPGSEPGINCREVTAR